MTRRVGSLVALALCAALMAGCGDDDEGTPQAGVASPTPVATGTPAPTNGPAVSYFGLARADGSVIPPTDVTGNGVPVFTRQNGSGFMIIVEGRPGTSGFPVALSTYQEDLSGLPDLQIVASRPLGNGSAAVCDVPLPGGGVPAVSPAAFSDVAAVNDLACRFRDGEGLPMGVGPDEACTQFPSGDYEFVVNTSTTQYCAIVARVFSFPEGDTLLTVRLRDTQGFVGPTAQLIVRILPTPTPAPTSTPTATETPPAELGPQITHFGVTRADGTIIEPIDTTEDGKPIYLRRAGFGFSLVIEGKPGRNGRPAGPSAYQEDLVTFPDLQVQVSQPLGNGSAAVCDAPKPGGTPVPVGGVPAIDPPSFELSEENIAAVNDLACRFLDGAGQPLARSRSEACVLFPSGEYNFVDAASTLQFCAFIESVTAFTVGDTVVTARLRDVDGNVGPPRLIVVRVL